MGINERSNGDDDVEALRKKLADEGDLKAACHMI